MTVDGLIRTGVGMGLLFAVRMIAKWRVDRRKRTALTTPLVDRTLLEAVFAPRHKDGDDADLLAEMRDTFLHLNRRAYAEEFWGLHGQLTDLYGKLGRVQQETMRRALLRLLLANDRWLQLVAAQACADLKLKEAAKPLRALLALGDSQRFTPEKAEYTDGEASDVRYREELEKALAALG